MADQQNLKDAMIELLREEFANRPAIVCRVLEVNGTKVKVQAVTDEKVYKDVRLQAHPGNGVGIVQGLSSQLGISPGEVYDQMRKGQISSQMVVDVMMAMTEEGGRFHGMLERLRESFTGTKNVMISSWQLALVEGVEPLMGGMKGLMEVMISLADEVPRLMTPLNGMVKLVEGLADAVITITNSMDTEAWKIALGVLRYGATVFVHLVGNLAAALNILAAPLVTVISLITNFKNTIIDLIMGLRMFGMFGGVAGMGQAAMWTPTGKANQQIENAQRNAFNWIWGLNDPYAGFKPERYSMARKLPKWQRGIQAAMFGGKMATEPLSLLDPNRIVDLESTTGGDGDAEDKANKKRVANKLIGTGARDIVIHIGNLIENMSIATPSIGESADQLTERVKMAMLTAINDASILADR